MHILFEFPEGGEIVEAFTGLVHSYPVSGDDAFIRWNRDSNVGGDGAIPKIELERLGVCLNDTVYAQLVRLAGREEIEMVLSKI